MPVSKVFKTRIRMIRAAKLEALGVADAVIADHIGLSPAGFATMKQSIGYQRLKMEAATDVLSQDSELLAESTEDLRSHLRDLVPTSLQRLADAVTQRLDLKLAMNAASEILDRDGRFMKASRQVVTPEDQLPSYLTNKDDETVTRIIATQQPAPTVADMKPASEKTQ